MERIAEQFSSTGKWVATALVVLALAVILPLSGCLHPSLPAKLTHHNHKVHAGLVEAECSACHTTGEAGVSVRPNHKHCAECHDINTDKPGDDCLKCHVLPPPLDAKTPPDQMKQALTNIYAKRAAARQARQGETPWDHSRYDGKVPCATCHGDVVADKFKVPHNYHLDNIAPDSCELCHATNRKDVAPRSHAQRQGWTQMHGNESLSGQIPGCKTCHQQNFCDDCHRTEKPRSHTATFKNRGHGFMAEGNRRSCETCHQQDFCQSCHQTQAPSSHNASFRRSGHCRSCHEKSTMETKCKVCHTFALSQHPLVTHIQPGRPMHDLPQNYYQNMHTSCASVCHGPPP